MSLAILLEPISVSLFHHLVSQGPAAQAARSPGGTFALRQETLTCARHAQGPSGLTASLCLGTTAGHPGFEGFDDHCSAGLPCFPCFPGSWPPSLPGSRAPMLLRLPASRASRLHAHTLLLPASPGFGLVLVFPSFTSLTPSISGSLQPPYCISTSQTPI